MIPNTGLSGTVDCITGKMDLDSKQDATNNFGGVNINPIASFQQATHASSFEMLNVLDVVRIAVLPCVMLCRLSTPNNKRAIIHCLLARGLQLTMSITCSSFSTLLSLEVQNDRQHLEKCFFRKWRSTRANTSRRVIRRRHPFASNQQQQQQQQQCYHYKTHTKYFHLHSSRTDGMY